MKLPKWLHKTLSKGKGAIDTARELKEKGLCTVCEEAKCPNLPECYRQKRATFLVLGSSCTRSCAFCAVGYSQNPPTPDEKEPAAIVEYCRKHALQHIVLTMVTRDDLEDGGADHFIKVMREIRKELPRAACEVLTSDFQCNWTAIESVAKEKPEVFAHNVETVRSLSSKIRCRATYEGSLEVLRYIKKYNPNQVTKSSIMLGLGETYQEVIETLKDLADAGVEMVTMGQYLQPTKKQLAVREWITPERFLEYENIAKEYGIQDVMSGPFVRSSYAAHPLKRSL